MQNLAPIPRDARPALPDFAPVPRKYSHDGWTAARQKAFIEALADTGSVSRQPSGSCTRRAHSLTEADGRSLSDPWRSQRRVRSGNQESVPQARQGASSRYQ
jgi:hypothetical protein